MKQCSKCSVVKEKQQFHASKRTEDGLLNQCRLCLNERRRCYAKSAIGRDRIRQSMNKYRGTNNGRIAFQQMARRRRERMRSLDLKLSSQEASFVYEKFQSKCFKCDSLDRLQIDHHYPLSKGFGLTLDNAVLLCKSCNVSKSNHDPESFYTADELERLKSVLVSVLS